MHDPPPPRKVASVTSSAALPFAALLLGNLALAFGPWFVRAADVGPVAAGFWRLTLGVPFLFAIILMSRGNPVRGTRGLWDTKICEEDKSNCVTSGRRPLGSASYGSGIETVGFSRNGGFTDLSSSFLP